MPVAEVGMPGGRGGLEVTYVIPVWTFPHLGYSVEVVDGKVGEGLKGGICCGHADARLVSVWMCRLPTRVCGVGREEMTHRGTRRNASV